MQNAKKITIGCLFLFVIFGCSQQSAEELKANAEKALQTRDYNTALLNYKTAVQQEPENLQIRLSLATLYMDIGLYQNAEKELKRAKPLVSAKAEIDALTAKLLWHLKQYDQLKEFFEVEMQEENPVVTFYAFLAYQTLDEMDQARALVTRLEGTVPDYATLAEAYIAFTVNDNAEATRLVDIVLSQDENVLPALKLQIFISINDNDYEKAKQVMQKYALLAPYDISEQLFFAATHLYFKETEPALLILNAAEQVIKGSPALDQYFGLAHYLNKDFDLAKRSMERAIQNGARSERNRLVAGYVNYALGNYEQSYNFLLSIKDSIGPDHPAIKVLAISQMRLGKVTEAAELLKNSVVNSSNEIPAYTSATNILLESGQFELAKQVVEQVKGAPSPSPTDIIQIGLVKVAVNDPSGLSDIQEILETNPDMIEAQMALVSIYLQNDQKDELIALAKTWQAQSDVNKDLGLRGFNLEAVVHEKTGNPEAAEQVYLAALDIEPSNIHSHVFLAKSELGDANFEEADKHIQNVLNSNENSYEGLLLQYNSHVAQGRLEEGLALLLAAQERVPERIDILELYGTALHAQKKYDQLIEVAESKSVISQNMYQVVANAYLLKGDDKNALATYKEWSELSPGNRVPFYHTIYLLETEQDYIEALKLIQSKMRDYPMDDSLKEAHAQFLLYTGRMTDAQKQIEELKKVDTDKSKLDYFDAQVLFYDNQFEEALPGLLAAYETEPTERKAHSVAVSYIKLDKLDELIAFSAKHLAEFPDDFHVQNLSANINMQAGNYEAAKQGFEKILSEAPRSAALLNNVAWLNYKLGNMNEALSFAQRALKESPDDYNLMDTAAVIYLAQGDIDKALSHAEAAYNIVSKNNAENRTEVTLNYIKILDKAGKTNQANKLRQRFGL